MGYLLGFLGFAALLYCILLPPKYRVINSNPPQQPVRRPWHATTLFCDVMQQRLRVGDTCAVAWEGTIVLGEVIELTQHGTAYRVLPVGDPQRCTDKVITAPSECSLILTPQQVRTVIMRKLAS